VPGQHRYAAVAALDGAGRRLGESHVIALPSGS
jgi:hypothetical protein